MSGSPQLGFVGLGAMGSPMAGRLLAAGHPLVVHDIAATAVDRLVGLGATSASSPAAVADAADIVFTSVPNGSVLRRVTAGPDGLLAGRRMSCLIDLSTIGPEASEAVRLATSEASRDYVDAPVSGGVAGAREGRLTIMAAGAQSVVDAVLPLLETLGSKVVHVSEQPGHGQLAKVLNNLMSASSIIITAEALSLGVKGGLDPARLLEVINTSSGRNTASAEKFPRHVLTRTFDFGFRLELMAKDVALALEEAARQKMPVPLGAVVDQMCRLGLVSTEPGADSTEIARMYEEWAGVVLGSDAT